MVDNYSSLLSVLWAPVTPVSIPYSASNRFVHQFYLNCLETEGKTNSNRMNLLHSLAVPVSISTTGDMLAPPIDPSSAEGW